jgi:outer membrane protein TolC
MAEDVLVWENCVREARQNHPELISAVEKIEQSKADKAITKSQMLPSIGLTATEQRGQSVINNLAPGGTPGTFIPQSATTINNTFTYAAVGKQIVFDGFKISNNVASASEKLTASEYSCAVVSSNIRLQLRQAFVELFRAQELLSLTEDIARRRQQNLKLVSLRFKGGREHRGALLTAEASLSQAEFEIFQAKGTIELSQNKLIEELGRGQYSSIAVNGDFEVFDKNQTRPEFESLAKNTPLLRQLITLKEAARFDLKSAKADYFPKVYLDASIGNTDSDSSFWPPSYTEWIIGLSIYYPLIDGGKRTTEILKAESLLRQIRANDRSMHDKVICTLVETWTGLQNAIEERAIKEKFLQAAQERATIANAQYSIGLIPFNDWIIIEDNLVMYQKLFLDAKANVLIKEACWAQAKGETLEHE